MSEVGDPVAVPLSSSLAPQFATLVDGPPVDIDDWFWELKFDGYRLLARIENGEARLFTRNGHDWTAKMPQLARTIAKLPVQSAWIDGEVIIVDDQGVPDFQALQNAFDGRATKDLVYCAFDLPFVEGQDLRSVPNIKRHKLLSNIIVNAKLNSVRFSEPFRTGGLQHASSASKVT